MTLDHSRIGPARGVVAAIGALCLGMTAHGAGPEATPPAASFALRAGRVLTASANGPAEIPGGLIVVRDGRIAAVLGSDAPAPMDLPVIDLPDAVVAPGLVCANSGIAPPHAGEESISGAYRASDSFNRFGDFRSTLSSGVTTAHLSPGWHRLVSGRGAVVRLAGPADSRVLSADADITVNLVDGALNPPALIEQLVPPSSDNEIMPGRFQLPMGRMGRMLALREVIAGAAVTGGELDVHALALAEAWRSATPLRIQAQHKRDLVQAITFLASAKRPGYIVGGQEAARLAPLLSEAGVPLVYTIDAPITTVGGDLGPDPLAFEADMGDLASMDGVRLALALPPGRPPSELRFAAAMARRGGLSADQALAAVTRVPAQILGVADRVGSIEVGKDADLLVMSDSPLEMAASVHRVYVRGRLAYARPEVDAVVVRAGTIWLGPNFHLRDGAILVENGRITQVGPRVGAPPGSRVVDAGKDGFVAPGFIDAFGHLGLAGDDGATSPELSLAPLVGAPGPQELRVAAAGVTTVVTAPARLAGPGSQLSAIKTDGQSRAARIVSPTAGVAFDVTDADPATVEERIKPRLDAAKRYQETWQKYEKDLAEWEKQRASGATPAPGAPRVDQAVEAVATPDAITGTWSGRISGGPMPRPMEGKLTFRLSGTSVEGRVIEPAVPIEHRIVGEFDGKRLTGRIEVDTGGMGTPQFEGTLVGEDHMTGTVSVAGAVVNFDMRRIDKAAVEYKVTSRRKSGKDGRPTPPKVDPALEALRAVIEKRAPLVVSARGAAHIKAVLDLADQQGVPLVLINADDARHHAARIAEKSVGVAVPPAVVRAENNQRYHQADDLSRSSVSVAFQSDAEDGARLLPSMAGYAVAQGLSPEAALAALTIAPARMYKLESRVGAIAPGLDADLLIFSGHPFDAGSRLERVLISGKEVRP